jgi:hypothetical protein
VARAAGRVRHITIRLRFFGIDMEEFVYVVGSDEEKFIADRIFSDLKKRLIFAMNGEPSPSGG